MMTTTIKITTAALLTATMVSAAHAHDGRRFDIQIKDGQLITQGYISGDNPTDDGNGLIRDYYNAIHAHWENIGGILSRATLPGFDVHNQSDLLNDELWLTETGVKKWADAPFSDYAGGHNGHGGAHTISHSTGHGGGHFSPGFIDIPADEWVEVSFSVNNVNTPLPFNTPFLIDSSVGNEGHYDLTFDYQSGNPLAADVSPDTALYLVAFQLSTSDPSILPSDTIHAILSPPGASVPGSHGLSLATEEALGTPVPEPASLAVVALLPALMRRRRASLCQRPMSQR